MFKNRRPIGGTEEVVEGCLREVQEIAAGEGVQGLYRLSMGVVETCTADRACQSLAQGHRV